MNLRQVVKIINEKLPIELVAEQDNVGLIAGNYDDECEKMTAAYELESDVLDEVVSSGSNLVVTYHTPLFRPAKSFTSSRSRPDPVYDATRYRVNVFAVHTALDVVRDGLNFDLAERLGLKEVRFLSPLKNTLYKIVVFVPHSHLEQVRRAMARGGAGKIGNYSECSFEADGKGTFLPNEKAFPFIGSAGKLENTDEARFEMIVEKPLVATVLNEMLNAHPYEEVAYDIYPLLNDSPNFGFGAIGELDEPVAIRKFLDGLKDLLDLKFLKVSQLPDVKVKRVALCAGAGVPFYRDAVKSGADVFITGDVKHHDFREAQSHSTILVDATHRGTEKFAAELIYEKLKEMFDDKVAVGMSKCRQENAVFV
ncbi:MAG: Nif3-like dinuclear metal center hexameric protein [Bacteroidetes bacterium]|nr:Nif3-like dinuclear metal center hexameric protein [Bacteroidota bacterium]MCL5738096.1 Nif3-like dinuclear metal center hexameric protein [Bacteroidota bacterium]